MNPGLESRRVTAAILGLERGLGLPSVQLIVFALGHVRSAPADAPAGQRIGTTIDDSSRYHLARSFARH